MSENRILDRRNYSGKTLETFEVMSAFYVDIFYNHLYIEAKKLKAKGNVSSITEGYKYALNAFLKSLSNPELYKKSIVGVHDYFIKTGFNTLSFSKCIDRITHEFVPTDYFSELSTGKKMGILRLVINQALKSLIRKIASDHMSKIIDYHKEVENVRILQDELIDCFIMEREGMYQRFISDNTQTNKNESVNRGLAERMQSEIKKLVREKYSLEKSIKLMKKYIITKKAEEKKQTTLIKKMADKWKTVDSEKEALRSTINELQSTIREMQYKQNVINSGHSTQSSDDNQKVNTHSEKLNVYKETHETNKSDSDNDGNPVGEDNNAVSNSSENNPDESHANINKKRRNHVLEKNGSFNNNVDEVDISEVHGNEVYSGEVYSGEVNSNSNDTLRRNIMYDTPSRIRNNIDNVSKSDVENNMESTMDSAIESKMMEYTDSGDQENVESHEPNTPDHKFIEVNSDNLADLIKRDASELHDMSYMMDSGTSLADFGFD